MQNSSARRDLRPLFSEVIAAGCTKMAAAASPNSQSVETSQEPRRVLTPASLPYPSTALGALQTPAPHSPASTESLLAQALGSCGLPAMGPSPAPSRLSLTPSTPGNDASVPVQDIFLRFSELLEKGLAQTAAKITGDIKVDFQSLGERMGAIESKLDITVSRANQNTAQIQLLQEQLETAIARIDDLENRSRRQNLRIRGLPESITDTSEAVQDLFKSLIPNISQNRLELDRAHRALGPPRKDGNPRDIIVKPHFFSVKEEIMKLARSQPQLQCKGFPIQIFADLSPMTIQRRRNLKPLLTALAHKGIKYWWTFPFGVKFSLKGRTYAFSSLLDGEKILLDLKIISQETDMDFTASSNASSKRPTPTSPITPVWNQAKTKRSKDNRPP